MHNLFRWFRRDDPDKPPQIPIEFSDTPPAPIYNPAWQEPAKPQEPFDIQLAANRIAAIAWAFWQPEPLAKTQRATALREAVARRGPVADDLVLFAADNLPLMENPFQPDEVWQRAARVKIQDAFAAMHVAHRQRLRNWREMSSQRLSVQLTIARPMRWDGMKTLKSQLAPVLAGLAVQVLDLPDILVYECVMERDAVTLMTAVGTPWWSVAIRGDTRCDEGEEEVAA